MERLRLWSPVEAETGQPEKLTDVFAQLGRGVREFREANEGKSTTSALPAAQGPSCGAAAAADATFCQPCGAALPKSAERR